MEKLEYHPSIVRRAIEAKELEIIQNNNILVTTVIVLQKVLLKVPI